jgi:hypothetical protein
MFSYCDTKGPERINTQEKKATVRCRARFIFERVVLTYPIWIGRILFYGVRRSGNHSIHWYGWLFKNGSHLALHCNLRSHSHQQAKSSVHSSIRKP